MPAQEIPWLSANQRIEIDRAMVKDYRIDIRVPPSLYAETAPGFDGGAIFATGDVVRL
jgi:hypothetical protein